MDGHSVAAQVDPAPLFDLVTGFPPDDAVDVMVPMPLSLTVYMTMLESTGHAAELAAIRKVQIVEARETARRIQAGAALLVGDEAAAAARLRVTHIVEERIHGVNGLRPHVHAFVGASVRLPDGGGQCPVDVAALARLADADLYPGHCDRLAAATSESVGLVWEDRAIVGPRWLTERTEALRHDDLSCPGPWPRHQIVAGRAR